MTHTDVVLDPNADVILVLNRDVLGCRPRNMFGPLRQHVHCSSRHLMLASLVFRAMLRPRLLPCKRHHRGTQTTGKPSTTTPTATPPTSPDSLLLPGKRAEAESSEEDEKRAGMWEDSKTWSPMFFEAKQLTEHGQVTVELPEDDTEAMTIVLAILHHKYDTADDDDGHMLVPMVLSRQQLALVAALVDKYDVASAMKMMALTWRMGLDSTMTAKTTGIFGGEIGINVSAWMPNCVQDELFEWLCLSWVFGYADIFAAATRVAMKTSTGRLEVPSYLALPRMLIDDIETQRLNGISSILSTYKSCVDRVWINDRRVNCLCGSSNCDYLSLGILLKKGRSCSAYPIPEIPYPGLQHASLLTNLLNIDAPVCCQGRLQVDQSLPDLLAREVHRFDEGLKLASYI